jgi:hypothetical protein
MREVIVYVLFGLGGFVAGYISRWFVFVMDKDDICIHGINLLQLDEALNNVPEIAIVDRIALKVSLSKAGAVFHRNGRKL